MFHCKEGWGVDPCRFAREALGQRLWDGQERVLARVAAEPRVLVRSGQAVGKTFCAAAAVLWWVYTRRPALVLTTAPTARQVEQLLWGEIRRLRRGAAVELPGEATLTRLQVSPEQQALGFTSDEPERVAGWHSPNVFVVVDEASGVGDDLFEALHGAGAGAEAKMLLIGNPTRRSSYFCRAEASGLWAVERLSSLETPNFAPGATLEWPGLATPRWAAERAAEWGEESDAYRVRVLGEHPRGDARALVEPAWVTAAEHRGVGGAPGLVVVALDVARYGPDRCALAVRRGDVLAALETWSGADLMATTGRLIAAVREQQPAVVIVDADGLGAGVYDRLAELRPAEGPLRRASLVAFHGGGRAYRPDLFAGARDEAFWGLRTRLQAGTLTFAAAQPRLTTQLTGLAYGFTSDGRVKLESKEDLRRRGAGSPDEADAVAMAFWVPAIARPAALGNRRLPPAIG